MKTWYRKISRDLDRPQGYLPRFNTDEREEPKPQTVTSPIIDTVETEEENSRTEEDSQSAHTTSPQTTSFKNKDEFKATMLPIYAKILSQMGLNTAYAKMLVAQDGLESAWGTKPSGKFNFGGIKGTGSIKRTREVIDGKDVYINDSFRDFASLEDYAKYKISLLNNNRYKAFTGDLSGFADRVSRGGYATDPNYAETLKRVIASAKHGGILKFQAGGTGEIRPDNRSWFKRKWDDIATAYNSSSWANSAPASIIAGFTPYGLFHYSASGDEDSARLAVLPGAVGTKEVAKNAVKAAEEGVNLVYRHYGNDISKYFQGALKWLRNARKGSIPAAERLEVPKQISKIRLGNPKHDYAFFKDAKTGETILEISPTAQNPLRSGEKAASKQFLQELVGTKDDFGLRGLSYAEKELFPKKFLSAMTQENSAKDIYSKIMSHKAEAGIKSSFTELTEAEARKIFDIGWDANLFYPTTSSNALQTKETFWKENKDVILKLFRRVPVILGAGVLGNEVVSERRGGIIKAQQGADTRQWVDNWLSQRKDKLKNNAIYSGLFALPGLIKNPYFRQVKSMSKYSFKKGDLPGRTTGTTNHREKIITTSDDSKSTEVHEWTHAARPYEQIAKVKEIIDRWGLRPGIMRDDYLDKPSEIYSRLMELRYNNNLDPNHEYTLEEVRELRNKNHTGDYLIRTKNQYYKSNINNPSIPEKVEPIEKAIDLNLYKGAEELFERYNDSTIQSLLNDVAQVPNKRSAINYAKAGLKIPKYQNPASTIERTSEPWRVWNDYSNQGSMDPNWRVPLKKDPLPQKKYNVKRNYDKKAINDYGESYYDIVKTRVRDAHDALIRNGFSEDVKRLQEPLSAVSIKETGWRLTDPKNNYFGLLINGGKKASYKTKEESWDATIAYLNKRYGIGNLNGPWWESDSIEDFVNRINNPELDTTLHSQEDYDRYNRDRVTSGETPQYMHAPYWNNRNKRYNDEVKDIIDRYYGYYYME